MFSLSPLNIEETSTDGLFFKFMWVEHVVAQFVEINCPPGLVFSVCLWGE
jgi:hypothetical protein